MRSPRSLSLALVLSACASDTADTGSLFESPACVVDQAFPYAESPYVGLHGNAQNNNYVPCDGAGAVSPSNGLLPGFVIFQPVSLSADGATLYATAARTEGCALFAVDPVSGAQRWCADGLSLGVSAGTPEVDEDGNLYVTDGWIDESWMISYTSGGEMRWRTSLEGLGGSGPATYRAATGLHLTPDGHAAMVTVDGVVVLVSRDDGAIRATFDIPGATGFVPVAPEESPTEIPDYFVERLEAVVGPMTAEQLTYVVAGSAGEAGVFANNTVGITPAGQILVVGGGPDASTGALVALDVDGGAVPALTLRWSMPISGGSGTSPAISPDGRIAAIGDGDGNLVRVDVVACNDNTDAEPDAATCAPAWTWPLLGDGSLMASPGVDEDGVIYAWHTSKTPEDPDLFAIADDNGEPELAWEVTFATAGATNRQWTSSATVTADAVLGTLTDIEQAIDANVGFPIVLSATHETVAVSRTDGSVIWRQPVDDDSINSIAPGPDGEVFVPLMGMIDLASPSDAAAFTGGIAVYRPTAIEP